MGVRADGAVVIPYARGNKIRKGLPHGERAFFFEGDLTLFSQAPLPDYCEQTVILVEGETDTMRLWQELHAGGARSDITVVGLPGIETWPKHAEAFAAALAPAKQVYVILDNDDDYMVQGRVDTAWQAIRETLGIGRAKRRRLPRDVKDICAFFQRYDMETFQMILGRTSATSKWSPLDFTLEPPPVQWLVDGMFCQGDVNLLLGEPGIGKSWLSMALALSVAQGKPFLGHNVAQGKVMYLDEENSLDLVYDRFRKLGITPADAPNIRYLSNEGILLDRGVDELLEEALEFGPKLFVLDSLTRFHSGDEDKAGSMSQLYNNALKPLARKTGAAILLLHHAGKTDSNSSYRRSRGSGEIIANADAGFDVRQTGVNALSIANFKSRRRQMGETINVVIRDTPEGGVELIGGAGGGLF